MNYWLLTTEYPPFFGGGISTYGYFTAKMMAAKGHNVTVFVNDASISSYQVQQIEAVRIVRFSPYTSGASDFLGHNTNISYEFAQIVKTFIKKEGAPHVIEAQEYLGIAYYLLQFKHLQYDWCKNVPVIITAHSPSFLSFKYNHVSEYKYPNYWICEMERACLQAADLIIAPSQYILEEIKRVFKITHNRITVVPNPYEGKSELVTDQKKAVNGEIIFYGKLTAQKGAFKLLKYFDELWKEGFTEPLTLIGGQDIVYHPEGLMMGDIIRKKYKHYIQQHLLKLEDRIDPSQIAQRLANAKVIIIPSENDNLPYVAFEMLELGNIVLASKQGGHSEVIEDGVDGFLFDHFEEGSFAAQLKKILQLSVKERTVIAQKAFEKVKQYHTGVISDKKIAALESAISIKSQHFQFPFIRPLTNGITAQAEKGDLLSIVIPYYNMGAYIDDTMASLQKMAYSNKEVVIVNDGSNDVASIEKLNQYRSLPFVRVIDIKNGGLGNARNTGAKQARGTYLAFLDADDTVSADYYSKAVNVLSHFTNVHFVGCWVQYFENSKKIWPTFNPEPPIILYHNTVNSSALVYRRSSFLAGGTNDTQMTFQGLEDYESVVSMVDNGFSGVVLPEALFQYRVRGNSMIRDVSKLKKELLHEYISQKHKPLYNSFATDVIALMGANGAGILIDNPTLDYHLSDKIPLNGPLARKIIGIIKKNRVAKNIAYRVYKLIS